MSSPYSNRSPAIGAAILRIATPLCHAKLAENHALS